MDCSGYFDSSSDIKMYKYCVLMLTFVVRSEPRQCSCHRHLETERQEDDDTSIKNSRNDTNEEVKNRHKHYDNHILIHVVWSLLAFPRLMFWLEEHRNYCKVFIQCTKFYVITVLYFNV